MRRPIFALVAAAGIAGMPLAASAQEPLYLKIRPGLPPGLDGDGIAAAQAAAARESVWQRADRRARIAIASVCTGCLPPDRSLTKRPVDERPAPNQATALEAPSQAPLSLADLSMVDQR